MGSDDCGLGVLFRNTRRPGCWVAIGSGSAGAVCRVLLPYELRPLYSYVLLRLMQTQRNWQFSQRLIQIQAITQSNRRATYLHRGESFLAQAFSTESFNRAWRLTNFLKY